MLDIYAMALIAYLPVCAFVLLLASSHMMQAGQSWSDAWRDIMQSSAAILFEKGWNIDKIAGTADLFLLEMFASYGLIVFIAGWIMVGIILGTLLIKVGKLH